MELKCNECNNDLEWGKFNDIVCKHCKERKFMSIHSVGEGLVGIIDLQNMDEVKH